MMFFIARVSGHAQAILPPHKIDDELRYQINLAMKKLYREGCRRMRAVRMPRTGDDIKYRVMGWPK